MIITLCVNHKAMFNKSNKDGRRQLFFFFACNSRARYPSRFGLHGYWKQRQSQNSCAWSDKPTVRLGYMLVCTRHVANAPYKTLIGCSHAFSISFDRPSLPLLRDSHTGRDVTADPDALRTGHSRRNECLMYLV